MGLLSTPRPQPLIPVARRAKLANACLYLNAAVHLLAAAASGWLLMELYRKDSAFIDAVKWEFVTNLADQLHVAYWVTIGATTLAFLSWFGAAYRNSKTMSNTTKLSDGMGMVYLCWFIPIANMFLPYQYAREIWIGSHHGSQSDGEKGIVLVTLWWTAWLLSGFIALVHLGAQGKTPSEVADLQWWGISVSSLRIVAALALGAIIRRVTSRQNDAQPAVARALTR